MTDIDFDAAEYKGLSKEQIYERIDLTKEWIALMLFTQPRTTKDLIKKGCKVMVYGHPYEVFMGILDEMESDRVIEYVGGNYELQQKGIYNVKRASIVPLLNLVENEEYTAAFIEKNKENCDTRYLTTLYSIKDEEKREAYILSHGEKHYDKLSPIINLANTFLQNVDKFPTGS